MVESITKNNLNIKSLDGKQLDTLNGKLEVNYKGRKYQDISCLKSFGRGLLGTLAVIFSLGFALFSKKVRALFTKKALPPLKPVLADPPIPVKLVEERLKAPVDKVEPRKEEEAKVEVQPESPNEEVPIVEVPPEVPKEEIKEVENPPEIELDPAKKLLLEQFTPEMVEALGGIDAVLNLPVLEGWNGDIKLEDLSAPVMRGFSKGGKPFLLFSYLKCVPDTVWRVDGEYLGRGEKGWKGVRDTDQFSLGGPNFIQDGTAEAKYMLDKIKRAMKGEAVGLVQQYKGIWINKPEDVESFRPDNAYLEGDELTAFMKLSPFHYEKRPPAAFTELFLCDPKKTKEEIMEQLFQQFPAG
jgi:hypothetical protein